MAVDDVCLDLVQAVKIHKILFDEPDVPLELVWELREKIEERTLHTVGCLAHHILVEVVDVLRYHNPENSYDESEHDAITVTAIWWCLHHGLLDPSNL